ncbi:uncharacterized protein LOC127115319 [Lathyrus oleraceus]|uniref:uncharacterized protein LOC127115319 n=1 Tax=Pisum sativum TaxID=3888 RepID=UPI0021CFAE17|nr:uncharacterized protein LOC127115319 [Pisum sativum]
MNEGLVQIGYTRKLEDVSFIESQVHTPFEIPYQQMEASAPFQISFSMYSQTSIQIPVPVPFQIPVKSEDPIVFHVPASFLFESTKFVPWNYNSTTYAGDKPIVLEPVVTNIAGIGGMTRSGRVFAPEQPSKGKTLEGSKKKETKSSKKTIAQEEAEEFLRLIRKSDYKVVDQLSQTPSKISILSLLLSFEAHTESLLKILNEAHVTQDMTVNQFDDVVANITASNCLGFTNDELPPEGHAHNKALHISVKCQDSLLSMVLVDTGLSLNVMPKNALGKLNNVGTSMKVSTLVVKAFDYSKKMVIGEVDLPIIVGPHTFMVIFQVMDINPSYSCLIGRPWIHVARVVTSTLHQRLKFIIDDKLIIIEGGEDMFVSHNSSFRYIKADGETLKIHFQALEIAVTSRRREQSISP